MATLKKEAGSDNDYKLVGEGGAWVTVGNKSVWIRESAGMLFVEVFKDGKETQDPIESIAVKC